MDRRALSVLMILGVVVACATPLPAVAEPVMHARVSYESGGAMIKGPGDSDWSYATLNTLILANDTLWADTGALLEFEMVGGSFLRMADRSKAEVVSLPPSAVIRAWTGSFYAQRTARSTGEYKVQAPAATLVVDKDTHARIDIVENGATTVSVRWGRVTVQTQAGSPVVVTAGLRVYVDPGFLPSAPAAFDAAVEDDFDAWSRERAEFLAVGPNVIPSSYGVSEEPLGVADLARYGSWVTVDNTPYWRPTTAVDYVPYRSGLWSYVPSYGHVWVGEQPFSYVTSHYGRWTYDNSYGWLWSYRDQWAPAWVAAVRSGPNFIWTPLDPFNRPCTVGGYPYGYGGYGYGYDGLGYGYSPYGYGGYGYDGYRYGRGGYGYGQDDFSFAGYWDFGSFRFSIGASSYCPADRLFSGYGYPYPGNRYPYGGYGSLLGDFASLLGGYGSSYGGFGYPYGGLGGAGNVVGNDIEIWNIFGNTINADLPWIDGRYPLSSYTPTRVVRGPDQLREGDRTVRAVERIGRLEQSVGRTQFASVERSGSRLQQTALRAGVRSADVRRVEAGRALRSEGASLSQRLPREARATDTVDRGAARATRSVVASGGNRSTGNDRGAVRTRSTERDADASRTIATRSARTPEVADDRGRGVATRSGRDGAGAARTAREPRAIALDRSAAGGSERAPRARAPEQAGTPERRAEAGRTARTPDRAGAEAALRGGDRQPRNIQLPGRSGGAESRVPARSVGPEQSRTATRGAEAAPSPRSSRAEPARTDNLRATGSNRNESAGRSVATRTPTQDRVRTITLDPNHNGSGRGQGPGASARVAERTPNAATAPSRTVAPREPRSATRTAPQASARGNAERRTAAAPRVTVPPSRSAAPAPNTRTQVSREVQRPRVTERSVQQAPRRQVQAPRASAPRQVESPRPAAPRQVVTQRNSAPQRRSEAPRMQAPQRRSEAPRIQAPQRRVEAPRIQAPERREAPRIQAPQRRSEAPEPRSRISTRDSRGGGDSGKRGNFEREGRGR